MSIVKKPCVYCAALFSPNPRVGDEQKSCPKKTCRKKRHAAAHARWWKNNPKAYQGRAGETQAWRKKHPKRQREWRGENPEKVAEDNRQHRERRKRNKRRNAEIQDAILRRKIGAVKSIRGAEIQDECRLKIAGILDLFESWPTPYRAEIQDSMASGGVSMAHSRP